MEDMQSAVLGESTGFALLGVFGVIWVMLGIYWGRKARDLEGFMLAGRNVGLALGAATAMATWVTSNTVMLAPMFALQLGVWGMLAYSTASFGLFLFAPMAFRIRRLMPSGFTSGDFIRLRYGKVAWVLFLVISFVYSMAWLVSMGMAGGVLLNALAGIDYRVGMSAILLVCVLYTLFGGLYAVIGTDFIQSVVILIGVVVVGAFVLGRIDIARVYGDLAADQPMLIEVLMPVALLSLFNNMFFGFGEVFHNNVWWSRAFAMRDTVSHKAFFLSGLLWFPIPVAAGFIALAASSLGINVVDANMVGPLVASKVLGQAGAIAVFVVVFCSLASSIDSLLAATSDLIVEDVWRKMIQPGAGDAALRRASTGVVIGLGLLTWLICLPNLRNLIEVLFISGPLVASAIWPVVAGLYWRRANPAGAVLAMLLGSVTGLIAYFQIGWFTASLISMAVSLVVTGVASLLGRSTFEWGRLNEHPTN